MAFRPFPAFAAIALSGALAACGSSDETAPAADGASGEASVADAGVIDERQDNFELIGDSFGDIRDELDTDAPDFALIASSAQTIDTAAKRVAGFFPEGTGMDSGADTEALAAIWEQPEQFALAHQRLTTASAALLEASASQDTATISAAAGELGAACKNCHDTFRLDDE